MKALVIVNDEPLRGGRCLTGLRLAGALLRMEGTEVGVFLVGAAVSCALGGWDDGGPRADASQIVVRLIGAGADVRACAASLLALGIDEPDLLIGVVSGTSSDLAALALGADRLLVF